MGKGKFKLAINANQKENKKELDDTRRRNAVSLDSK